MQEQLKAQQLEELLRLQAEQQRLLGRINGAQQSTEGEKKRKEQHDLDNLLIIKLKLCLYQMMQEVQPPHNRRYQNGRHQNIQLKWTMTVKKKVRVLYCVARL